ncbi:hypothetical protein [Nonomuraea salmonea]|uniref:Peptidase S9 prolyl oligopeptidase catalytic domain-containing protein n=1 Tax=Nonomuraea salmonea TaxID=46181 RepID=A0ABV5P489_9ACTN
MLLQVEEHGGHGAGATREQDQALLADVLAFLLHAAAPAGGGGATS